MKLSAPLLSFFFLARCNYFRHYSQDEISTTKQRLFTLAGHPKMPIIFRLKKCSKFSKLCEVVYILRVNTLNNFKVTVCNAMSHNFVIPKIQSNFLYYSCFSTGTEQMGWTMEVGKICDFSKQALKLKWEAFHKRSQSTFCSSYFSESHDGTPDPSIILSNREKNHFLTCYHKSCKLAT